MDAPCDRCKRINCASFVAGVVDAMKVFLSFRSNFFGIFNRCLTLLFQMQYLCCWHDIVERNFKGLNEKAMIVSCEKVVICFAIWLKYLFQRNVINRYYLWYFPLLSFYIKYKSGSMEDTQLRTNDLKAFSEKLYSLVVGGIFFFFF